MTDTEHIPGTPEPVEYLVYIAGIQVPCESVTVSYSVGNMPTCTLTLPPDPLLRGLGRDDLLHVVVWYLDYHYFKAIKSESGPEWCHFFEGLVVRAGYNSTGQGRTFTLTCVDLAVTMQMLRVYWLMNVSNMLQRAANATGQDVYSVHSEHIFPASLLYYGLDTRGAPIKKPFELVQNVFKALVSDEVEVAGLRRALQEFEVQDAFLTGGVAGNAGLSPDEVENLVLDYDSYLLGRELKDALGQAEPEDFSKRRRSAMALGWWGRLARRTGFIERWLPMPLIEDGDSRTGGTFPILEAARNEAALKAVRRLAASLGDGATLWDIITSVYNQMLYEVLLIPSPACVAINGQARQVEGPSSGAGGVLAQYVTKPRTPFAAVPACNVIWPSMSTGVAVDEDYLSQPTRLLLADGNLFNVTGLSREDALQEYYNFTMATAHPPAFQALLDKQLGRNGQAGAPPSAAAPMVNPHNVVLWPEEYYRGPVSIKGDIPSWFIFLQNADPFEMNGATSTLAKEFQKKALDHLDKELRKLKSQDARRRLTDVRDSINTLPTSVEEGGADVTAQDLILGWVSASDFLSRPRGDFYPTAMAEAAEYNRKFQTVASGAAADRLVRERYAAQEFLMAKYRANNGGVQCVFHPYVVPGLPGMFFDKQASGYHLQGMVASVTHNLSPQGASTSIGYSYGRTLAQMVGDLQDGGDAAALSSPRNPIDEVYRAFQTPSGVTVAYSRLLYANGIVPGGGQVYFHPIADIKARVIDDDGRVGPSVLLSEVPRDKLRAEEVLLEPKDGSSSTPAFNAEKARTATSRPVCTLPQWLAFNGVTPSDKSLVPAGTTAKDSHSKRYWFKILDLAPDAGVPPKTDEYGNLLGPFQYDTRRDWQKRLQKYRNRIYHLEPGRLA